MLNYLGCSLPIMEAKRSLPFARAYQQSLYCANFSCRYACLMSCSQLPYIIRWRVQSMESFKPHVSFLQSPNFTKTSSLHERETSYCQQKCKSYTSILLLDELRKSCKPYIITWNLLPFTCVLLSFYYSSAKSQFQVIQWILMNKFCLPFCSTYLQQFFLSLYQRRCFACKQGEMPWLNFEQL